MDITAQRFVTGCESRIFINSALGCQSNCSYCYLGDEGFPLGNPPDLLATAGTLIDLVDASGLFREGRNGSLISIGCFSECWDSQNIEATIALISYYLEKGNPVQFASKRCVRPEQVDTIASLIRWEGQLGLFVSSASVKYWKNYEFGTTNPDLRFKYLGQIQDMGLKTYLYLKPVIEGITIQDISYYLDMVKRTKCDVVVGSMFCNKTVSGEKSPISSISGLYVLSSQDEADIVNSFDGVARVFKTSTAAVEFWRASDG